MSSSDALDPLGHRSLARTAIAAAEAVAALPALEVREGDCDLEDIERFRDSIYIAEQHKPLPAADHLTRRLPDEDDRTAYHFCIRNGSGQLVAYARLHCMENIPVLAVARLELGDLLRQSPETIGFISKLMVAKTMRGRTNAVRLIMSMIQYSCERFKDGEGAAFHCSSALVPLYTRMGFRVYGKPFIDPHVGLQTPMVVTFRDVEHFEKCGSPIASVLRTLTPHDGQPARFRDYFLVQHPFRPHNQILGPDQPRPSALSGLRKASVDLSERRGLDSRIKLA
jgi:predicted GNAT family N-acyltransferase